MLGHSIYHGFNVPETYEDHLDWAVKYFNAGYKRWCTFGIATKNGCARDTDSCDKCLFCASGPSELKLSLFSQYVAEKGFTIHRRGLSTNQSLYVKRMEE